MTSRIQSVLHKKHCMLCKRMVRTLFGNLTGDKWKRAVWWFFKILLLHPTERNSSIRVWEIMKTNWQVFGKQIKLRTAMSQPQAISGVNPQWRVAPHRDVHTLVELQWCDINNTPPLSSLVTALISLPDNTHSPSVFRSVYEIGICVVICSTRWRMEEETKELRRWWRKSSGRVKTGLSKSYSSALIRLTSESGLGSTLA